MSIACLPLCAALLIAQTSPASDSLEAITAGVETDLVLKRYFSAIRSGSVLELREIFGDPLLSQFEGRLRHSSHIATLAKTYERAEFAIIDSELVSNDYVQTTVEIMLENSECIREKITLARDPSSHRLMVVDIKGVPLGPSARSAE